LDLGTTKQKSLAYSWFTSSKRGPEESARDESKKMRAPMPCLVQKGTNHGPRNTGDPKERIKQKAFPIPTNNPEIPRKHHRGQTPVKLQDGKKGEQSWRKEEIRRQSPRVGTILRRRGEK